MNKENKSDLISREALKKAIDELFFVDEYTVEKAINNAPIVKIDTNDIEYKAYCKGLEDGKQIARQQGEWIEVTQRISDSETTTYWECSICKEPDRKDGKSNFCPNCGAKMQS